MIYTDDFLSKALDGYWYLVEGEMPPEIASNIAGMGERAPFETPAVLKADLDMAIDMLSPGRWSAICHDIPIDDLHGDVHGKLKYKGDTAWVYKLSWRQQSVVRYHLLNQEAESGLAYKARGIMLKFLNGRLAVSTNNQKL